MNVTNYRNYMYKESLVSGIILIVYARCTGNAMFTTTSNDKLTFIHIGEVDFCLIPPEFMQFKSSLVAEDIIVEVIINVITVGRSLSLDNNEILNICTQRIILL